MGNDQNHGELRRAGASSVELQSVAVYYHILDPEANMAVFMAITRFEFSIRAWIAKALRNPRYSSRTIQVHTKK